MAEENDEPHLAVAPELIVTDEGEKLLMKGVFYMKTELKRLLKRVST